MRSSILKCRLLRTAILLVLGSSLSQAQFTVEEQRIWVWYETYREKGSDHVDRFMEHPTIIIAPTKITINTMSVQVYTFLSIDKVYKSGSKTYAVSDQDGRMRQLSLGYLSDLEQYFLTVDFPDHFVTFYWKKMPEG